MVPAAGRYDDGSATRPTLRRPGLWSGSAATPMVVAREWRGTLVAQRSARSRRPGKGRSVADDVTTEVVIDDGGSSGRGRLTLMRLSWRRVDPFAVNVVITPQPDHPSLPRGTWVVLRDFLRYGMEELTGDGDVKIHPDVVRNRVWLELK